jgi:uncharacterized protein with ParB-like and HNH nuclease domain
VAGEGARVKIACVDKEVRKVLDSGYYTIPRFQRPYRWRLPNVEDFWTDTIVSNDSDYFIGSIVVYRVTETTHGIVDGQQRLTTITMLLCALRDAFQDEGFGDLANGTHNLIERRDIEDRRQYVLQTETSYPYLQEHIQKFAAPEVPPQVGPEERNLQEAFEYICRNLKSTIDGIKSDKSLSAEKKSAQIRKALMEIRDKVLRLKLIFIELENEDDAYVIFETINTRGEDLKVSDVVKTHVLKLLKPKNLKVDLPKEKWSKMVELLEGCEEEDLSVSSFLHHFWLSKYDYTTEKKLFKDVKKRVKQDNITEFFEDLTRDARLYRQIHETTFRKWRADEVDIRNALRALSLFKVKQQLPRVISVLREYDAGRLKRKHASEMLRAIENFHFCFTAVTSQRSSGGISMMYALHARNLLAAKDVAAKLVVIRELKEKLRDRLPSRAEFVANFSDILCSDLYIKQRKLVQYVLDRITEHHSSGVALDYDRMTIEHLAAQNGKTPGLTPQDIASLGNLLLVDPKLNNKLGNKEFPAKKAVLQGSQAWLDDLILNATTWGSREIHERTAALAALAFDKVWKI